MGLLASHTLKIIAKRLQTQLLARGLPVCCSKRQYHLLPVWAATDDKICLPTGELRCIASRAWRQGPLLYQERISPPLSPFAVPAEPGEARLHARAMHPVLSCLCVRRARGSCSACILIVYPL